MKNHRDVCFATCAGYTEFDGLPGKIMSGCPNTPDFKSCFCSLHKATAVIPQEVDSQQLVMDKIADSNVESPAAMILGKRSTRHSNFYQV